MQISISVKNAISHAIFSFLLTFAFGLYGFSFVAGFFAGAEIMQTCYRSFTRGYKWADLWSKPWILLNYLHPKDTLLDLITYLLGALVGYLMRS